ncbi:MAG: hypothetical protein V1644_01530 [Candidatus Micrarchaeota archaeon]
MPREIKRVEWETTSFKGGVITHLKQHSAADILHALAQPASRIVGRNPPVHVHAFGKRELAVRHGLDGEVFEILRMTAAGRAAVVELPVARVDEEGKPSKLVTLWKKGNIPFMDFVRDPTISFKLKMNAGLSAARSLAKLHAAGFVHLHAKTENVVVNKNGKGGLVDPILTTPLSVVSGCYTEQHFRDSDTSGALSMNNWAEVLSANSPHGVNHTSSRIFSKLYSEYYRHYIRLTSKKKT